jgi:myosin protein heavy chain
LEAQETERNKSQRSVRNVDRSIKDLQTEIDRKERANTQLNQDVSRHRDKIQKLLETVEELHKSDAENQMSAKRAEAKLREEKEKALKLEKELETLKTRGGGTMRRGNSGWASASEFGEDNGVDIPQRRSSLRREVSMSKGFL